MIVAWLILLSKWHRPISSLSSPEDLSDVTFHVLIKRHRVLDKTYLLSSFPWPPLLGHAPHVSVSYVSEVLRRLPMPLCLDLAITDIALRAILYSVTFTDSQNKTCFQNFPEGWSTPSYLYQSSFSCSQQAFPAAISCFCFLHITPVLMATLFVIISIFTEANLATVPYYSRTLQAIRLVLSTERTWWPFRTLRTIHAIRPVFYPLNEPGDRSVLYVPYTLFVQHICILMTHFSRISCTGPYFAQRDKFLS